jgi:integrase
MKWLNKGEDINKKIIYLSSYMGHSNIEATAYYIHLLPANLVNSASIDWNYFNSLIPEI